MIKINKMDERERLKYYNELTKRYINQIHVNEILRKFNKEMLQEAKQETTSINKEKD